MSEPCYRCKKPVWNTEFDKRRVCSGCNYFEEYCKCETEEVPHTPLPVKESPHAIAERINDKVEKLDTIRFGVIELLKNDVRCRNNDMYLQFRYYRDVLRIPIFNEIPFEQFERMPSFESIRRVRQFVQNTEGMFMPTEPDVRKQRRMSQEKYETWVRKAKHIYKDIALEAEV